MFWTKFLNQRPKKRQATFSEKINKWIMSKQGRNFRIGTLALTIVSYPTYHMIMNGPLVKYWFKQTVDTDELDEHLQRIVNEELESFKEREFREGRDTVITFHTQKNVDAIDSVAKGSIGVRFGAQIALPLAARFHSVEEAEAYAKKFLEPLEVLKRPVCVLWDTKLGKDLAETFVLSDNAKKFLIARDIYTRDGYQAYANAAISFATWTTFSSLFTYYMHQRKSKGFLRFMVLYAVLTTCAVIAHHEWHKLYRYMNEIHSDTTAARISAGHCLGGIEYYVKLLRRNQLLRNLMDDGPKLFTPAGDVYFGATKYLVRYAGLKDLKEEHAELANVVNGDVF